MPEVLVLDLGLSGLVDLEAPRRATALWDAREVQSSFPMGSVPMQATPQPLPALQAGAPDPLLGDLSLQPSHREPLSWACFFHPDPPLSVLSHG